MKRVFPLILALLFIAILVASCLTGCNRITAGEVYDKYYIPAHSESYTTYERVYDDGQYCSVPVLKFRYVPAEYRILIRRENDKGEWDTASYEVGKERYDSIKIGDEVSFE